MTATAPERFRWREQRSFAWIGWWLLMPAVAMTWLLGALGSVNYVLALNAPPPVAANGLLSQLPLGLHEAVLLLWLFAVFSIAPGGVAVGLISLARRPSRVRLLATFGIVIVAGVASVPWSYSFFHPSSPSDNFVHGGGLTGVLLMNSSVVVGLVSYLVLIRALPAGVRDAEGRPA